jgi:hypothetical protein
VPRTSDELIERAIEAYDALVTVAEAVDDEWQYVTDLSGAWRARLREAADGRPASDEAAAAVDAAGAEIALIDDPHRAIDWLSTFPQIVLIALGTRP